MYLFLLICSIFGAFYGDLIVGIQTNIELSDPSQTFRAKVQGDRPDTRTVPMSTYVQKGWSPFLGNQPQICVHGE